MYNEEYLVQIEEAIKKLQNGERVASIAYGDHVVRYAEVQINDCSASDNGLKLS